MRFLVILTTFALTACGIGSSGGNDLGLGSKTADCPNGAVSDDKLNEDAKLTAADLGIPVGLADRTCQRAGIDCEPLQEEQGRLAELYIETVRAELGRYPRDFLKAHGPRQIWLVDDLKMETVKWEAGGVTTTDRTIYLNVNGGCTSVGRSLVVQHEFFHVLDIQLFVNAAWNKAWTDLNPPGFRYGADYNKVDGYALHDEEGFATSYATTNMLEDRAETYTYRVVEEARPLMTAWLKSDAVLAKKDASLQYWVGDAWPELSAFQKKNSIY